MGRYGGLDRTISRGASQRRFLGFGGIPAPSLRYRSDLIYPTIDNLPSTVTINGQAGTTVFRYKGGDLVVSPSVSWPAWGTGETLSGADSGDDPTPNDGSPLLGVNDDSAKFNGGVVLQASGSSFADITTEDFYIEFLYFTGPDVTDYFFAKGAPGATGYRIYYTITGKISLYIYDGSGYYFGRYDTEFVPNTWYFVSMFLDRNEATNSYAFRIYANNMTNMYYSIGGAGSFAAVSGSLTTTKKLTIGSDSDFGSKGEFNLAYLLMAKKSGWFAGGAQNLTDWAAFHQDRFYSLAAVYPQIYKGTQAPTFSRASTSFLRKTDSSGNIKYYQMGSGWPRSSKLLDDNGTEIIGLEVEESDSEYCLYSTDASGWSDGAGSLDTPTAIGEGPLHGYSAYQIVPVASGYAIRYTDSPANSLGDTTGQKYFYFAIVSKGSSDWVRVGAREIDAASKSQFYFNLSTLQFGTITNCDDYGYELVGTFGGKPYYLLWGKYTSATGAGNRHIRILWSDANGGTSFTSDGSTPIMYFCCAGLRIGANSITSPIVTTTATVTRAADSFYFKGDDGNLGGVGSDKKGSLFLKSLIPGDITLGANLELAAINDGGDSGDEILLYADTSGHVNATITASGGTPRTVSGPAVDITDGIQHKIQLTWQAGRAKIWVDNTGGTENTDVVAADIPDTLDRINPGLALISDLRCYPVPQWGVLS